MMDLTKRRIWFAVFVLIVFVTGLTTGVVLDRYLGFGRPQAFGPGRPPLAGPGIPGAPGRRARPADIVDRMSRDLDLSAEQRAKMEAVFERSAGRMRNFQAGTRKQFEELRREIDGEIAAILTPEQREKWEEQQARRRRARQPRGPGSRGGVPPPPRQ